MKFRTFLSIGCLCVSIGSNAAILSDDFNDGVIDPSRWQVILPFGQSSVTESSGALTTVGRGILASVQNMPMNFTMTGSFRLNDPNEYLRILLRTDLSLHLDPSLAQYSERRGISVVFWPNMASIQNGISGGGTLPTSYAIGIGQTHSFSITDDSQNISFSIDGNPVLSLAVSDRVGDRIAFYSREFSTTSSTLDNISVVPEPSSLALIGIGTALLAGRGFLRLRPRFTPSPHSTASLAAR